MKDQKIGIIIVTYNAEQFISPCLASLEKLTDKHQIVVIDNASTDKTLTICSRYASNKVRSSPRSLPRVKPRGSNNTFHVIRNTNNRGFAYAVNQGIHYLQKKNTDYFLLLNPDTVVHKNVLHELLKPFQTYEQIGITGPVITYVSKPQKIWFGGGYIHPLFGYTKHRYMNKSLTTANIQPGETDFITGCCMMIKKEVITSVGVFDEKFFLYFEDVAFCYRAKNAGFISYLVNKPLVTHHVSASTGGNSNSLNNTQAFYYGRNPLLWVKKYVRGYQKFTFLIGYFLIATPYYLFKAAASNAKQAYLRGLWSGLRS